MTEERCIPCEKLKKKRVNQAQLLETVKAAKAYRTKNKLSSIVLVTVIATGEFGFCEYGDERLGNEFKQEQIMLAS